MSIAGATSFNQVSVGVKMIIELNNTFRGARLAFHETRFIQRARALLVCRQVL